MARSRLLSTVLVALALGGTAIGAEITGPSVPAELQLMRAINTAQADVHRQGTYAELRALLPHRMVALFASDITAGDNGPGHFRAHRVALVLSADGQRYQVSIVPEGGCGEAWFSDERGLIYRGQVIGCPR